jgi:outer membrane receptor protein involved in Fe transport
LGAPAQVSPDTTTDYEVGIKSDHFDHRLSLDLSLYYVDWKGIQITNRLLPSLTPYGFNGPRAKSEGFELSVSARPWEGMTVNGFMSYDNAVLTQSIPSTATVYGAKGDPLPITPKYSGDLSLEQRFPFLAASDGFVGLDVAYVGERLGYLRGSAALARQQLPAYTKLDFHVGAEKGGWLANLYITNLTDERGLLNGGVGYNHPGVFVYIPPREFGFVLSRRF